MATAGSRCPLVRSVRVRVSPSPNPNPDPNPEPNPPKPSPHPHPHPNPDPDPTPTPNQARSTRESGRLTEGMARGGVAPRRAMSTMAAGRAASARGRAA